MKPTLAASCQDASNEPNRLRIRRVDRKLQASGVGVEKGSKFGALQDLGSSTWQLWTRDTGVAGLLQSREEA